MLKLSTSPYYQLPRGEPKGDRSFEFIEVLLRTGQAVRSGTADDFESALVQWRDNDEETYWFPKSWHDFPNIDSIVKLEVDEATGGNTKRATETKGVRVAYLQMNVCSDPSIDAKQLQLMNTIFRPTTAMEKPLFVFLGPSESECLELPLTIGDEVLAAQEHCEIHIGCYEEKGEANLRSVSSKRRRQWGCQAQSCADAND